MENLLSSEFLSSVTQSQISLGTIVIVLVLSTVLGFAIAEIYQKTFSGTSYSTSFVASLIVLVIIAAVVMLAIGSDLARAFGLVGALSIIRFRTAIKDPKDISFIFLSLIIGISVGTLNYHIAIIATVFVLALIYVMSRFNYGSFISNQYYLTVDMDKNELSEDDLISILNEHTKKHSLNNVNSVYGDDKKIRMIYSIVLSKKSEDKIISAIRAVKGVSNTSLASAENYISH
ncbi:DUF4956 domain-containing protein [Patescibacteria group bacterium]